MGLLDDAIREHLDLKRRRGADPSEIAREEDEALGPVRRGDVAEADEPLDGPYADDDGYADEAPSSYDDAPAAEHPLPSESPHTHADPYAETEAESATPPHGDPLAHQQTREFSAHELDEALGQRGGGRPAEPEAAPARDAPEPEREREPEPPSADRAPAPAREDDDDPDAADELEDTPDFLQETPEHDRLWFEQKPPKDFDF